MPPRVWTGPTIRQKLQSRDTFASLAAVRRLNPGQRPALYASGSDHAETLEIDDETMIASIAKVQKSIERKGPHPRRLRVLSIAAAVIVLAGLLFFWLPMAMITYTASVVPQAKRADIGEALLAHIQRLTGAPCDTALGAQALADLQARLRPDSLGLIVVLRGGALPTRHLPGTIILLNRIVVEDYENPDVTAGDVSVSDPLRDMLVQLGLRAAFELLKPICWFSSACAPLLICTRQLQPVTSWLRSRG